MTVTDKQQLNILIRDVLPVLTAVVNGLDYNPGHSDLDDVQPEWVQMSLGDYRRARRLFNELTKVQA